MGLTKWKRGKKKGLTALGGAVLLSGMLACNGVRPDAHETAGIKVQTDLEEENEKAKEDRENGSKTEQEQQGKAELPDAEGAGADSLSEEEGMPSDASSDAMPSNAPDSMPSDALSDARPSVSPVEEGTGPAEEDDTALQEKEARARRQRTDALLEPLGAAALENIEKYIAAEEIGEGGATDLNDLQKWKNMDIKGRFIADGYEPADQILTEQLLQETGKIACWIIREDFDGDGRTEAFAFLFDLKDNDMTAWKDKEVWFAAADGTLKLLEAGVNLAVSWCMELPGETFFVYSIYSGSLDNTRMYKVEGNTAKPALDCRFGVDLLEDGRIWVLNFGKDMWSLSGHYGELPENTEESGSAGETIQFYYYYYDNGLHEYGGVPVTQEEFCQYENGEKILRTIREQNEIVKDIYYYGDGRMVVNFMDDNIGYEGRPKGNYYLQVPVLAQGEDGFVLGWDDSFTLWQLYANDPGWGYDVFAASGIYQPSHTPELAQYAEFLSPLEYYKEKYAALAKKELQICVMDADGAAAGNKTGEKTQNMPVPGEVLADGRNILEIDGNGLVICFTPEYDMDALVELAQKEGSIGIWISGEYICGGLLQKEPGKEAAAFLAVEKENENFAYQNCLIYRSGEAGERAGTYHEEAQVKLRAFAETAGLWREKEIIEIRDTGLYESGQDYRIDLNGDGVKDILRFEGGSLWINGREYGEGIYKKEALNTDVFMLGDIDTKDGILEIGLWEPDTGPDGHTGVYWYDGSRLQCAGSVEGIWSVDGPAVKYYRDGRIAVKCRLHILQVWWTDKVFYLNEEHKLEEESGDSWYYPEDDPLVGIYYEVLKPIRIYTQGSKEGRFAVLPPGDRFFVMRTDDKNYITVEPEQGPFGWLYLKDGMKFERPEGGYYERTEEVIGGLRME